MVIIINYNNWHTSVKKTSCWQQYGIIKSVLWKSPYKIILSEKTEHNIVCTPWLQLGQIKYRVKEDRNKNTYCIKAINMHKMWL